MVVCLLMSAEQFRFPRAVLGAGISGLSFAEEYGKPLVILEKDSFPGGLCRSFEFAGIKVDVGPHIIFSKHQEILERHSTRIMTNKLRRLNRIFVHKSFVKFPFENDLGSLPNAIRDKCLDTFLNNPYENLDAQNMSQFFLKTFGESISYEYLIPYNKKIWKYDPTFLDLQMVGRIPKPPREDVEKSAMGIPTEGYEHQLYFYYPKVGGFQALVDDYVGRLHADQELRLQEAIKRVSKEANGFIIETEKSTYFVDEIVSTIPLPDLISVLPAPKEIVSEAEGMLYNSIYIVLLHIKEDILSDQFALYVPDEDIIFHRMSRLNFLGECYLPEKGGAIIMCEITYRPNSALAKITHSNLVTETVRGLKEIVGDENVEVLSAKVLSFDHAYVIYDLLHRQRTDKVIEWVKDFGINVTGRFGKFEYQNSDQVVLDAINLAQELRGDID